MDGLWGLSRLRPGEYLGPGGWTLAGLPQLFNNLDLLRGIFRGVHVLGQPPRAKIVSYLVDSPSSHMLVPNIEPYMSCMCTAGDLYL